MKDELIEELKEMSVLADKLERLNEELERSSRFKSDMFIKRTESDTKVIEQLTRAIWSNDREKIQLAKLMTQDYGWCFLCLMYDCAGECGET